MFLIYVSQEKGISSLDVALSSVCSLSDNQRAVHRNKPKQIGHSRHTTARACWNSFLKEINARHWWLTPIILATRTDIRRIEVQGQP
jgi:hypothetical protein